MVDKKNQEKRCKLSNPAKPETFKFPSKNILRTFSASSEANEKTMELTLLLKVMPGTERFNANNKKYAKPATHAGIISIKIFSNKI